MVSVDRAACWVADLLFFTAGYWAALSAVYALKSRRLKRLLWLVPIMLAGAWLESAFNPSVVRLGLTEGVRLAAQGRQMGHDLLLWAIIASVFIALRNVQPVGAPTLPKSQA